MHKRTPVNVFISYKKHDLPDAQDGNGIAFVSDLASRLREQSSSVVPLKIWYDANIKAGADWDATIASELASTDVFVSIYSPGYFDPNGYIAQYEIPAIVKQIKAQRSTLAGGSLGAVVAASRAGSNFIKEAQQWCPELLEIQAFNSGHPIAEADFEGEERLKDELVEAITQVCLNLYSSRRATTSRPIVERYTRKLNELATFRSLSSSVQPEDQLKPLVKGLIESLPADIVGEKITVYTEANPSDFAEAEERPELTGVRLDMLVTDGASEAVGHIELKSPDKGLPKSRTRKAAGWSAHDLRQWKKLQNHPNLIYTNGLDWALFRDGELLKRASLSQADISDTEVSELIQLITLFMSWVPAISRTPKRLAEQLAPITRMVRDTVEEYVQTGNKLKLRNKRGLLAQYENWRQTLIPGAKERQFADAFAQTFTYALLLARFEGVKEFNDHTPSVLESNGHDLLAAVLGLMNQRSSRKPVEGLVQMLERVISRVDPQRLSTKGDPWLYFYEHFLSAYDPEQRKAAGVYYTPAEIVKCQVSLADHIIRTRFGSGQTLGSESTTILDPAVGTGTYPLGIIEHVMAESEPATYRSVANRLAKQLFAFELMVGPYAVANLRFVQRLRDFGLDPNEVNPNIYLTNTLISPKTDDEPVTLFSDLQAELTEQRAASDRVKRSDTRIQIVIGNPPYNNKYKMSKASLDGGDRNLIYHPDPNNVADPKRTLLDDFKDAVDDPKLRQRQKDLVNPYVFFWRWAIWKVAEQVPTERGIVSFIAPSAFIRGDSFLGARAYLRKLFDEIWVIDLGGGVYGAVKEENVFSIGTPVAIVMAVRRPTLDSGAKNSDDLRSQAPARVFYRRIFGKAAEKLNEVAKVSTADPDDPAWGEKISQFEDSRAWSETFVPNSDSPFHSWPAIEEIMPWAKAGSLWKRKWGYSASKSVLDRRWDILRSAGPQDRKRLLQEKRGSTANSVTSKNLPSIDFTRTSPAKGELRQSISEINKTTEPVAYSRFIFRAFDPIWCIPDRRICVEPKAPLWATSSDRQLFLVTQSKSETGNGSTAFASAYMVDFNAFSGRGSRVAPLWRDADATEPNLNKDLLEQLTAQQDALAPEDVFYYLVGILGPAAFAKRFSDELLELNARVPITREPVLFAEVAEFGRRWVEASTYGKRAAKRNRYGVPEPAILGGRAYIASGSSSAPEDYPVNGGEYDAQTNTLRIGPEGEIRDVSPEVYWYELSDMHLIGRFFETRGAPYPKVNDDEELALIRPERWEFDEELLRLIHLIEFFIDSEPEGAQLLERVLNSKLILASDLEPLDPESLADPKLPASEPELDID